MKYDYFGFKKIDKTLKQKMVNKVFTNITKKYDHMNDIMSLGAHRLWKKQLINKLNPQKNWRIIDVGTGSGDIAMAIANKINTSVYANDINFDMLKHGRNRSINKGIVNINWQCCNGELLPFPENYFDAYTIAFCLRNTTNIDKVLAEAYRVLKPGGKFLCLEFSKTDNFLINKLYKFYSFNIIPIIGSIVAKDKNAYKYLVESIEQFISPQQLINKMQANLFSKATYQALSGGIVTIHSAYKI